MTVLVNDNGSKSEFFEALLEDDGLQKTFLLFLAGTWTAAKAQELEKDKKTIFSLLENSHAKKIIINCSNLGDWDSFLLAYLVSLGHKAYHEKIEFQTINLPEKLDKLLVLALTVPPSSLAEESPHHNDQTLLEMIGENVLNMPEKSSEATTFIVETFSSLANVVKGKSQMYREDLWDAIYECGANSLPIISLTSLLLGLILAFVGSIQLKLFGAELYVASFVGVSMVRIMGALLTGIVIAGRTGANFAAIIGTMQVNEEVDALKTFGISYIDFLVAPRVIALTLMTPLLTLYANILGMFGGYIVGILMLDISSTLYIENTLMYLKLKYLWVGLFHAFVFGIVISITGCYQGIQCGRSAEAVGKATTSAVVVSLVGIIIATSIITVIFTYLGW